MSVLIKGLKLPKDRAIKVAIRGDDGIASVYLDEGKADYYSVIELPDHGDLIDRDAYLDKLRTVEDDGVWMYAAAASVSVMPAVIHAERSEASICDNCDERSDAGCSWCKRMERSEDD